MIKTGYRVTKSTVKGTVWVVRGTYHLMKEATTLVYHVGRFTFEVVGAPLDAPWLETSFRPSMASLSRKQFGSDA